MPKYFNHLFKGMGLATMGPTLLDLTDILETDVSSISYLFALRSIGGIIGSLTGRMNIHIKPS